MEFKVITKVDWISFTVDVGTSDDRQTHAMHGIIGDALRALHPDAEDLMGLNATWLPLLGRKPYSAGDEWPGQHIRLYYHPRLPHALFEITGQGCEILNAKDALKVVLAFAQSRLTRLDIASDVSTDTRPSEFVAAGYSDRFKSHAHMVSSDGETFYVGGRSSDRFARVYRYNPPHERSHLLRIEYQLKRENARIASQVILDEGTPILSAQLANTFAWKHHDSLTDVLDDRELASWRPERHQGKTEFWLETQVRPAIIKTYAGRPDDLRAWAERIAAEIVAKSERN
jgi:hypothetical protein